MKSALLEISRSKSTAHRLAKLITLAELECAISNLQNAANKIKKREAAKIAKSRAARIKALQSTINKLGLSKTEIEILVTVTRSAKHGSARKAPIKRKPAPKKGSKVPPKYALKIKGKKHLWAGRGRMPPVFKDYIESGGLLDSCLIKK